MFIHFSIVYNLTSEVILVAKSYGWQDFLKMGKTQMNNGLNDMFNLWFITNSFISNTHSKIRLATPFSFGFQMF
jgi:hypothetical protein